MKKYNPTLFTFFAITAIASLISVIVRCVLTATVLDAEYGVYRNGELLPVFYHIILALACIAFAVVAFLKTPQRDTRYSIPNSDFTVFACFAAAFLMFLRIALLSYNIVILGANYSTFDILEIIFSIPAIIYFIALPINKSNILLAITSFSPIAWCAVSLIRVYFDNSLLMTSPNKIISQVALVFGMLYFLNESRNQLGIFSHKFFTASAFAASVMLFTSALPNLFMYDLLAIGDSDSFITYAICAVLGLYIIGRLCAYANNPTSEKNPSDIQYDCSEE